MGHHEVPGAAGEGRVRTDMHCHNCSKGFVAVLDFGIDGPHVIECPRCGHEHYRVIKDGEVTDDRWDHKNDGQQVTRARTFWKSSVLPAETTTAAAYLRDLWLNRSG